MCRAFGDGLLQVTGHAGGNDRRVMMSGANSAGYLGQPAECRPRRLVKRRDCHHAAERETGLGRDRIGKAGNITWRGAAPRCPPRCRSGGVIGAVVGLPGEVDLNQARDGAAGGTGPGTEDLDQPQPVDRMNNVRVPDDAPGLVRLQLADEVPAWPRVKVKGTDFRSLACRLLVPV